MARRRSKKVGIAGHFDKSQTLLSGERHGEHPQHRIKGDDREDQQEDVQTHVGPTAERRVAAHALASVAFVTLVWNTPYISRIAKITTEYAAA